MKIRAWLFTVLLLVPVYALASGADFGTGWESGSPAGEGLPGGTGLITADAGTVRSGVYSLKVNANTNKTAYWGGNPNLNSGTLYIFQSMTFAIRVGTLPSATLTLMNQFCGVNMSMYMSTAGKLSMDDSDGNSSALSSTGLSADGLWHTIQINAGSGGSAFVTTVKVDGTDWITMTGFNPVNNCSSVSFGIINTNTGSTILYFDDFVSSGISEWLPTSKIILLKPVSDNSIGTWLAGAGGSSNLYDALNNIPPVGVATGSASNTTQIKNANSSGDQDILLNIESYTAGGLPAGSTVDFVSPIMNGGNGTATTCTGGVWINSNPAQTAGGLSTRIGQSGQAAATFPTKWYSSYGAGTSAPSVTVGTQPVLGIRKVIATTANCMVDFAGINVGYTPGTASSPKHRSVSQ